MIGYVKAFASLTLCLYIAGCGGPPETIKVSNGKEVPAEFSRLQDLLPPEKAAGSDEAFITLVAMIEDECGGDETKFHGKMHSRFNGKSVAAILDEYHELDPAIVAKYAPVVKEKLAQADAEETERFNKRINEEIQDMLQKQIDSLDKLQDELEAERKNK